MKKIILGLISMVFIGLAASAQWTIDSVNTVGVYPYKGTTSGQAVFSNGTEWNVFDANTNVHTFGNLSISRNYAAVVSYGDKVYFGGGKFGSNADPQYTNMVDVYDGITNTWSTLTLSKKRQVGGGGAAGNKLVFGGGIGRTDISGPVYLYATADIFDITTGVRTTGKLSKARSNISVGAAGNKIVFAGGWFWDMSYNIINSNAVDIYDVTTGLWTKTTLSIKRESMAVAVVGDEIIFAGGATNNGGTVKNVDIYNVSNDTWTTTNLPTARYGLKAVVVGTNAYFAGGLFDAIENEVDIYNTAADSWSTIYIPVSLSAFSMSVINDKIYFAGGYISGTSTYSNLVQIYDPATSTWSTEYLSIGRRDVAAVTVVNKGYFAGGVYAYGYPVALTTKRVDILSTSSPVADFTASATTIIAGGTVDFSDQSNNNPTSWLWTFDGGVPSSSTVQNPTGIQYNNAGIFDVTLVATNTEGSSTITKTGYITVNAAPCAVPAGLSTTGIAATSATFSWDAVSGAIKYKVSWKVAGNNPWTTTTTTSTSKMVTGLLVNTAYSWKVKTVCSNGISSAFSANQNFTTAPAKQGDFVTSGLAAYPNPVTDQFRLSVSSSMQLPVTCTVFNMQGSIVKEFVLSDYSQMVSVSDWSAGNYYIRIVDIQLNSAGLKLTKQ